MLARKVRGTWHEQIKRLGEDRFFSGVFVVFTAFQFFSCVLFGGIQNFRIFAYV